MSFVILNDDLIFCNKPEPSSSGATIDENINKLHCDINDLEESTKIELLKVILNENLHEVKMSEIKAVCEEKIRNKIWKYDDIKFKNDLSNFE